MADSWIVSYNTKNFDLVSFLQDHDSFVMKKTRSLQRGDVVYLYIAKPYGCVLYRCLVTDDHVGEEKLAENRYAIEKYASHKMSYMELSVEFRFSGKGMTFSFLRDNGVGQLLNPSRLDQSTLNAISRIRQQEGDFDA